MYHIYECILCNKTNIINLPLSYCSLDNLHFKCPVSMNAFLPPKQAMLFMAIRYNFDIFTEITHFEIANWIAS